MEENDSEQHLEQILLLQDWMNSEIQLPTIENQLHMNQVQLKQSHTTKVRLGDERAGSKDEQTKGLLNQTSDDINSEKNKDQDNDNDDKDDADDHKPTAQEKKQPNDVQDISDSDNNEPMKKKRKKESFSLGCEVLCQHIEFNDGEPVYINKQKLQGKVQEAHQRLVELDAF